jgi:hypothetical protein
MTTSCWLIAVLALTASQDQFTWRPRSPSITVEPGPDNTIHVRGRIEANWNYAVTDHVPIQAGGLYRLSARLRVDRLGDRTPPPYLKCEFIAPTRGKELAHVVTETYDMGKPGQWQTLVGEFRVPKEANACWLAVEKGSELAAEIDALLTDLRLEPIAQLTALEQYRLKPLPASLEAVRGTHPRIYLADKRVAELRQAIGTTHAAIWKYVAGLADGAVKRGPPPYIRDDGRSGDEQLWQRGVGNTLPLLAIAYVLSQDRRYLTSVEAWAVASCRYKTWGLGSRDGMDLATGHQLFGLAMAYDWCYRDLTPAVRDEIRQTLIRRTSALYQATATGNTYWHRSYLQNHLWVNITGMAAAGLALFDETDDAACWIGLPLQKYRHTMAALGPDGASHEGVGYWEYGVEYMIKFMDPAETLLGVDLFDHPWWRNTAAYGLYFSLPRSAWTGKNCIVDIADCPRGHWYGSDYLLDGLARRYRDGHAQLLADQIRSAGVSSPNAPWLSLIWYDPGIAAQAPADLPTMRHFDDMGLVSARSGWSGDESLVVFKCGPFIGRKAVQEFSYDPGGGHVHPDANHFVLFGRGEWLIRDDGYHPKWTGQHNTLLIDGQGQAGEGAEWFRGSEPLAMKALPKVIRAVSSPELDQFSGDATAAYPKTLGLQRFVRHLLFVKPDALIVADDIRLDHKAALELRFHPEQPAKRDGASFVCEGKLARLRISPLTDGEVELTAETVSLARSDDDKRSDLPTVRLGTRRAQWRNVVALTWSPAGQSPTTVTVQREEPRWTFTVGSRRLAFDWDAGSAR